MAQPPVCPGFGEKLLACTDGSPNGQAAVAAALDLARACGSQVFLLQVIEIIPEFEAVAPDLRMRVEEEVRDRLEAMEAEAAGQGVALKSLVRYSSASYGAIIEAAGEVGADLIIMGRCGRTGLARLLLGSVTERCIGHSPINILVIPLGVSLAFERILVADDGSSFGDAAFDTALALSRQAGARLFGISVATEEGEIIEAEAIVHRLMAAANREGVAFTGLVPHGQAPDDAILQAALKHEIDLIVLGSHGRTGLARLLIGSVAARVTGQASCPVLVVRRQQQPSPGEAA